MAVVTPNAPEEVNELTKTYRGLHHRAYDMTVANADTWTSGIGGLEHVSWEADTAGDAVAAMITDVATGEITFSSAGTEEGILHTYSRR